MINGNLRESLVGSGRSRNSNISAASHYHHRGQSFNGGLFPRDSDANLDLFSKNRRTLSVTSSDEYSDLSEKLGRLSLGSAKVGKAGLDDILSSIDGGKHDYDWLLTPPGNPLFPSSEGSEQSTLLASRSNSKGRSVSTTKASRLFVSQSESNHSARPTRSSSVTRPSLSSSYSTYSSNRGTSILNTSSASVSSYTRPSSPIAGSPSIARPSTPSTCSTTTSWPSTPSKFHPSPTSSYIDKSRPSQSSRPSTPTSRPQIPANLISTAVRSNSRPSTATRRNPMPSLSSAAGASHYAVHIVSNGCSAAPASRPSSPNPRVWPQQQPIVPPDFPLDTPPKLRTTLPDRPISAARSRPGGSVTVTANQDTTSSINMPRRHSSTIVTRGILPTGRTCVHSNGLASEIHESHEAPLSDLATQKPLKSTTTTVDSMRFRRTISKKSLDMAMRHTDKRNGTGGILSLSNTTLFPQSVRSATAKTQSLRKITPSDSVNSNRSPGSFKNGDFSENGNGIGRLENGSDSHDGRYSAKLSEVDIYESSRYDAVLPKKDLKNMNWLHSIDDKSDQGSIFDNGFDPLPELFGLL